MGTSTTTTSGTTRRVPREFGFVAPAATTPLIATQRAEVRRHLAGLGVEDPEKRTFTVASSEKRREALHQLAPQFIPGDVVVIAHSAVLGADPADFVCALDALTASGATVTCLSPRVDFTATNTATALVRSVATAAATHADRVANTAVEVPGGGRPRKLDDRAVAYIRDHPEKTNRALASAFHIDERTVRRYKRRIREAAGSV